MIQRDRPLPEYQIERAWRQHPAGRPCARVVRGQFVCPFPLDPALGPDAAFHPWCAADTQHELQVVRADAKAAS